MFGDHLADLGEKIGGRTRQHRIAVRDAELSIPQQPRQENSFRPQERMVSQRDPRLLEAMGVNPHLINDLVDANAGGSK